MNLNLKKMKFTVEANSKLSHTQLQFRFLHYDKLMESVGVKLEDLSEFKKLPSAVEANKKAVNEGRANLCMNLGTSYGVPILPRDSHLYVVDLGKGK